MAKVIGGRRYEYYDTFKTRDKANHWAESFRSPKFSIRLFKTLNGYATYMRDIDFPDKEIK